MRTSLGLLSLKEDRSLFKAKDTRLLPTQNGARFHRVDCTVVLQAPSLRKLAVD